MLIKYNFLFFSEKELKFSQGNVYFVFGDLEYLYLMHYNSNKDEYCRLLSLGARGLIFG